MAVMSRDQLSVDQREAYDKMVQWAKSPTGILTVGGLAGVGKTVLISVFAAEMKRLCAYVTYTGRASSVLSRKFEDTGVRVTNRTMIKGDKPLTGRALDLCYQEGSSESRLPYAGTIHRLLYKPIINPKTEELLGWERREKFDRNYNVIVIDEASMVGDEILYDIRSHGVPILAVGDHGQLAPVMSKGSLVQNPVLKLEKIHRQAEGSPIIGLAHHIRNGGLLREWRHRSGAVTFVRRAEIDRVLEEAYCESRDDLSQIATVCWTNKMRIKLNTSVRRALGFNGPPRRGEQVICLRNAPPVYNGMRGLLAADSRPGADPWQLLLHIGFPDEGLRPEWTTVCAPQFNRDKTFSSLDDMYALGIDVETMKEAGQLFDFGYCCTVHKFQGSQARHVIFYVDHPENPDSDDWRRLAYTAVTRAAEKLTVVVG